MNAIMANGNPTPKHKRSSLTKKHDALNDVDNNISLSPLYDIFDNQLQYAVPSNTPSLPYDPYPLPYDYHQPVSPTQYPPLYPYHQPVSPVEYPLSFIQDNARKRQRRQTAGHMVVQTFFNRGSNNAAAALGKGPNPVPGNGGGPAQNTMKAAKKKQSTAQPRPKIAIPPNGIGPILDPNVNDVLSGRGGRINAHVGNVQFREIVAEQKKIYLAKDTKKLEKAHIAADIVYFIRRMEPPGRFLKEDANGAWWDIGDQKAIKKVGQALREDAPEIRDPDDMDGMNEQQGDTVTSDTLTQVPSATASDSTPIQTNRTISVNSESPSISLPIPAVTTSGGSNVMMMTGNKSATAVSGRGGKLSHTNSSGSIRANQGRGEIQQQQQHQQQPVQVDIRPPDNYRSVIPSAPPHRVGQVKAPFYGFRGGAAQRIGTAVSGAAASVMRQQQQQQPRPMHEFEVPAARNSSSTHDEAFGRTFHPPPDSQHAESSLISGLSGGASASAVSGMSGISALTDPMSSVSNSEGIHGQSRVARQAQLDRIRSNWATPAAVGSSDNTPTISLLNASNGIGSSLNNTITMNPDHLDDGMSWTHSLHGGGIGESARDDSVLGGGTGSLLSAESGGNFSIGGISAISGSGVMGESKSKHTMASGRHRIPRNSTDGLAAYYPGDASVASGMSITSTGAYSMSELSENLVALDLSNGALGPLHEQHEI